MSEGGMFITVHPKTLEAGLLLIKGFRKIQESKDISQEEVESILSDHVGAEFYKTLSRKLAVESDLEYFSEFIPKNEDVTGQFTMAMMATKNDDLVWIESLSGKIEGHEVCPDYMTLHTRSREYGDYHDTIELEFNAGRKALIKTIVFSKAFADAGFRVDEPEAWDDDEDEDEI